MYPTIHTIDDVLPSIKDRDEFVVRARDGYISIDYNYALPDSFDCPIRRECRGLKFDSNGKLIARPFHKFFNLHEKPHEIPEKWDDAVVMEKLDGSMIHPAMVNGELVFMTRAGVTEQSQMAMEACKRLHYGGSILDFCAAMVRLGATPIFEFTSPHNRIVVRYSEDRITLLALRFNKNGHFLGKRVTETEARRYGFPHVRTFDHSLNDMDAFLHHVRELKGMEGYVVRVEQQLIKVKGEEYIAAHRAKTGLLWEKDVLRLVLEDKIDDVGALLSENEALCLDQWAGKVKSALQVSTYFLEAAVKPNKGKPRKEFAEFVSNHFKFAVQMKSVAFKLYDGVNPFEAMKEHALKQTSSTRKAREYLDTLGVEEWKPFAVESDG